MTKLNCRGIGIVIDDEVPLTDEETTVDPIGEIVNQLKTDGISLLRYKDIPPKNEWDNFGNVAFILIDWSLLKSPGVGVSIGEAAKTAKKIEICNFIEDIHKKAFAPIFIFSNQGDTGIIDFLKTQNIQVETPNAYVLVKPKVEMKALDENNIPNLFNAINNWIHATPTIQLLTTWGNSILIARNQMFVEFYQKNHNWPSLLWKAYEDDHDNPSQGLSQVMFDNLKARIKCNLTEMPDVSPSRDPESALTDVLALTVMLPNEALSQDQIGCGDLFEFGSDANGKIYHLVVSCDCDCVQRASIPLYIDYDCIRLYSPPSYIQILKVHHPIAPINKKIKDRINPERGYIHKATESYIFPIDGLCFKVDYRSLQLVSLSDLKLETRKGRILPPYITDIRQRLAQWNQRVGFPKLPTELFVPHS